MKATFPFFRAVGTGITRYEHKPSQPLRVGFCQCQCDIAAHRMTREGELLVPKAVSQVYHISGKLFQSTIRVPQRRSSVTAQVRKNELRLVFIVIRYLGPDAVVECQPVQEVDRFSASANLMIQL